MARTTRDQRADWERRQVSRWTTKLHLEIAVACLVCMLIFEDPQGTISDQMGRCITTRTGRNLERRTDAARA